MNHRFWKAILRYGHLGLGKEVSVARYIQTDNSATIVDVMQIVSQMPGVKHRGMLCVEQINQVKYEIGKQNESENYYLQQLFTYQNAHTKTPKAA